MKPKYKIVKIKTLDRMNSYLWVNLKKKQLKLKALALLKLYQVKNNHY